MNKKYISLIALSCTVLQTACVCEDLPADSFGKEGRFALELRAGGIHTDVTTRTENLVDVNTFKVSLVDKDGISLIQDKPFGSLTETDRTLPVGTDYFISVESCTPDEAVRLNDGWGSIRFCGDTVFHVVADSTTALSLNCTMENAGLQVFFDEAFVAKFANHAVTTQDARALVFKNATPNAIAYYNITQGAGHTVSLKVSGSASLWADRIEKSIETTLPKGKITQLTVRYVENSGSLDLEFGTDTGMDTDDNNVTVK